VAIALENIRRRDPKLLEISFDTIAASGPNAALPHYRVTTATNRTLRHGEVMLVDSGGQYMDGTTDITRTVAIGDQPHDVKQAFTRVLQGVIAISRLRFPTGVTGRQIDAFARLALWSAGQDFAHGTGHGVGHYLCVHEGPQGISPRSAVAFQPGMIVSNEPGYYQEGSFGIRTENLIIVTQSIDYEGFFEFETLTYVPIDRRMIIADMLTADEKSWINQYHQTCRDKIEHRLSDATRVWFAQMTDPI
jgi:Xaa-Pro aminopeptidase